VALVLAVDKTEGGGAVTILATMVVSDIKKTTTMLVDSTILQIKTCRRLRVGGPDLHEKVVAAVQAAVVQGAAVAVAVQDEVAVAAVQGAVAVAVAADAVAAGEEDEVSGFIFKRSLSCSLHCIIRSKPKRWGFS
jgi:hypothetical protein